MQLQVFTIRDSKSESFGTPFFQKSKGEAIRTLQELTKEQKSLISKYPEDFDLYYVGQYDDQTGKIQPLDTPQHIEKAISLVTQ